MFLRIVLPLTLAAAGVAASTPQSTAGRAAERFKLDIPAGTPTPEATAVTPDAPTPSPAPTLAPPTVPENATVTAAETPTTTAATPPADAPGPRAAYTLDTPIHDLIANPTTKAVLDKDLPGLSDDENLAKFDQLGLRQFQPLTGGQLTDAMLAKVARDLTATGGASLAAPVKTTAGRKRRDESR